MNRKASITILSLLLFLITNVQSQNSISTSTEEEQITEVINKYITGTSYSYPEQVKAAFIPGAKMFLDKKDEPLYVKTVEEYSTGVAKGEAGKFNGRVTNILSIDRYQGIATVKLEVFIPSFKRRFIDMLLLKKLNDGWKIISKTAASELSDNGGTKKAIIVTSNISNNKNVDFSTGNSFGEVIIAYSEYEKMGYKVDIVSPQGGKIPLAYINPYDSLHLASLYNPDFMYALSHTKRPAEINPNEYGIMLFTGGSAPIFDIPQSNDIQEIARHIYEKNNGVIAAVCHGTAGIVNIKTSDGKYLVNGKNVNGYPDAHEKKDSPLYKNFPFIIEQEIEKKGGQFKYGEKGKAYHIIDGRLVTGQNFQSSKIVAQKSVEVNEKLNSNKPLKIAQSNDPEEDAIRQKVQMYFDGWLTGDTTLLGKAMHATCQLKYVKNDAVQITDRKKYLSFFKPRPRLEKSAGRILKINFTRGAASVKCELETPKRKFTDYFNMLKIGGEWYIVDKISTSITKKE